MDKKTEQQEMIEMIRRSPLFQGVVMTPERTRMLDNEQTIVRIVGGYKTEVSDVPGNVDYPYKNELRGYNFSRAKLPIDSKTQTGYALVQPGKRNCILPEVLRSDGIVHVLAQEGMNLGILVARAQSPIKSEKDHIVPRIDIDPNASYVNGSRFIYGCEPTTICLKGEETMVDVIPGRVEMNNDSLVGFQELIASSRVPYKGQPDLKIVFRGEDKFWEVQVPKTRGIVLGKEAKIDPNWFGKENFIPSLDSNKHYTLEFVIDC